MEEESYRQSRLCRLLGKPVAFAVVQLLAENRELTPSEIARAVGRSVQLVSTVLGAPRLAEVGATTRTESAIDTGSSIQVRPKVFSPLFPAS